MFDNNMTNVIPDEYPAVAYFTSDETDEGW